MHLRILASILLFFFLSVSPIWASGIPDSLQQKLDAVEKTEQFAVWVDYVMKIKHSGGKLENWKEISDMACSEASKYIEGDSSLIWCYNFNVRIKDQFANMIQYQNVLDVLNNSRPIVDSLVNRNNGHHATLASWYRHYGLYHYINRDMDGAIENYEKSLEANEVPQSRYESFQTWNAAGLANTFGGNTEKGLFYFNKADSIYNIMGGPFYEILMMRYYKTYAYLNLNQFERVDATFRSFIDSLHLVPKTTADRMRLDYAENFCKLEGRTSEALRYFESMASIMDSTQTHMGNKLTYAESICNCAMLAGDNKKASHWFEIARSVSHDINSERRNDALLEMQTKFKTSEKEAEIVKLEQEKVLEQAEFRNKIGLISIISLIGLGLLSFFLLQNRNKQKQLSLSLEKDRQIAENRDRLFSSITHDIRTPLALMMAPLERAESETEKKSVKSDIQLASRNGKRLMELFNQILDWNKAEAKALNLNPQVGQLNLTIDALCQRFEQQAVENGILFKKDIQVSADQVLFDFDKVDKILSNLIGNAIKFCDAGQEVKLTLKIKDQQLLFNVRDEGPGIEDSEKENLFKRYVQGTQGKIKGGTGIGLALVKELVTLMNGDIQLESELGKGTTFSGHLPFEKAKEAIPMIAGIDEQNTGSEQASEKPLILVVEDEPELLEFLRSALVGNYEVEIANSTTVGLSIAISRIPDIIISDWTLPDNNGGWLCREIQKNDLTAHIPVVILTAHNSDTHQQQAFDSGAVAWMNKPFKLETLQRQLKTILGQQKRAQQTWANEILPESVSDNQPEISDPFLQKVMANLEENFADEYFSVEKMAEKLFLSRVQLFRKIKNITGESPSILIRNYRLEKGRILLRQPDQTVSEVSFAVGFSDPSYFSRAYKKHFDVAPSQNLGNS